MTSNFEADVGDASLSGAQSYLVKMPTAKDKDKRATQFRFALRQLRLKPYAHLSQLDQTVSAEVESDDPDNVPANSSKKVPKEKGGKKAAKKKSAKKPDPAMEKQKGRPSDSTSSL